jgi:hypothetical protein
LKSAFSILTVLLALTTGCTAPPAEGWTLFTDSKEGIQFLSAGTPDKSQDESSDRTTITWSFAHFEDGTSGFVDATRMKDGSFAGFDVLRQAADLRLGVERSGKTRVMEERSVSVSGAPAIEFRTETLTSKGSTWYGVLRMLVLGETLYTVGITSPNPSTFEKEEIQTFLDSLRVLE